MMPALPPHVVPEGNYHNINNDDNDGNFLRGRCDGEVEFITVVDKNGAIHHYRNYRCLRDEGAVERLVNTLL